MYIYSRKCVIEIINAHESTGKNIFKLREIIHRVKGINNGESSDATITRFNFSRGI